jgi:hypothetical protein
VIGPIFNTSEPARKTRQTIMKSTTYKLRQSRDGQSSRARRVVELANLAGAFSDHESAAAALRDAIYYEWQEFSRDKPHGQGQCDPPVVIVGSDGSVYIFNDPRQVDASLT